MGDEAIRSLSVRIFGVSRDIGLLPTRVHSDVRTTVLGLTRAVTERGKPIRIPDERAAAVDAALRAGGIFGGGTAELAGCVSAWYIAQRAEGDADGINAYYDEFRAEGYTAALGGAQEELTHRCAELAGLPSAPTGAPPLVLDLGCGSGLSIGPLVRRGCAVLGIDLSLEMLRTARRAGAEVVQADMSQPLPLRTGLFDGLTSVSALQFLCEPAHGQRRGEHGQRRRKRRKNKGFLAPGGTGDEWAMSLAECLAAAELRERLRVTAGECPSLEQLQRQLPELLSALHDPADSGSE